MTRDDVQSSAAGEADFLAARLREAEKAAGMPVGMITAMLLRGVVEGWTDGEPGALARWIDATFPFDEEAPGERAQIKRALVRLEGRWRAEDAVDAMPERFGWS